MAPSLNNVPSANKLLANLTSGSLRFDQLTHQDYARVLSRCEQRTETRQVKIRALVDLRRNRIARRETRKLQKSLPARIVAADKAAKNEQKRRLRQDRLDGQQFRALVWELASGLRHIDRPARPTVYKKPKAGGRTRMVCNFKEVSDRARQYLLCILLEPFTRLHPRQFLLRGGRSAACKELLGGLTKAHSDSRFIHIDIGNFYGNVDHSWLEENLPFPKGIVRNLIHTGSMRPFPGYGYSNARRTHRGFDPRPNGRELEGWSLRGLPQGSALSVLVAEFVVAEVLRGIADHLDGAFLVNYSDNFGLIVRPETNCSVFEELMEDAFCHHPAGPFSLRISINPVSRKFHFLGYDWRKVIMGHASIREHALNARVISYSQDILFAESLADFQRIRRKVNSYFSAFCLAQNGQSERIELLQAIADAERRFHRQYRPWRPRSGPDGEALSEFLIYGRHGRPENPFECQAA